MQVDLRGEQIGRRTRIDLGLIGHVRETLQTLTPLLDSKTDGIYLNTCLEHYVRTRKDLDDLATGVPGRMPIHPQYVAKVVNDVASDDAIVTCDVLNKEVEHLVGQTLGVGMRRHDRQKT